MTWNRKQNCYAYAFNDRRYTSWKHQQPGYRSGLGIRYRDGPRYTCDAVLDGVLADNGHDTYQSDCRLRCPNGYHKIALAVDPQRDYHFFREDYPGGWSHKPGKSKVRPLGSTPWNHKRRWGKNHYNKFCGCMCTKSDNYIGS